MARFGKISDVFKSILGGAETAKDIMDKNFLTIDENATVLEALEKMKKYKVQILAITKDGRLVGEISLRLLVNELLRLMRVGGAEWSQSTHSSQSE
jgi:CBS domain-containing protein